MLHERFQRVMGEPNGTLPEAISAIHLPELRKNPLTRMNDPLKGPEPLKEGSDPEGAATVAAWLTARGEAPSPSGEISSAARKADPGARHTIEKSYLYPQPLTRIRQMHLPWGPPVDLSRDYSSHE